MNKCKLCNKKEVEVVNFPIPKPIAKRFQMPKILYFDRFGPRFAPYWKEVEICHSCIKMIKKFNPSKEIKKRHGYT